MKVSKRINVIRGNLMRGLTKNVTSSKKNKNAKPFHQDDIKRVLICRPNHRLGNLLLITPLVQEVSTLFPNCKIDLFVKGGITPTIFQNEKSVDKIIQLPRKPFKSLFRYIYCWFTVKKRRYDITINVVGDSSSGRLSTRFSNAKHKIYGADENEQSLGKSNDEHIAKQPIYNLREYLSDFGFDLKDNPIPSLNLKLSDSEIKKGKELLSKLVDTNKKTISLFTFATGDKCYSVAWWTTFYNRLKLDYPNYNFVEILPVENVSQINFEAPSFYSHDIRDMAALIANTSLFIGADSGIMHLAVASQTPTVGLFSITDSKKYEPYGNHSIVLNTKKTDIETWMLSMDRILNKG